MGRKTKSIRLWLASPDVPGLSTGCLVKILISEGLLIVQQRFSRNTKDERSLTWRQGTSLHEVTQYALDRPKDGWDIELRKHSPKAVAVRFDRKTDHSRPGGPGIIRFKVKRVGFLFDRHNCLKFQAYLKEALDLLTVSDVMES